MTIPTRWSARRAPIAFALLLTLLTSISALLTAPDARAASSSKAGVASIRYAVQDPAKIAALNASWTYNWSTSAAAQAPGVEFVPMLHRAEFVTDAAIAALTAGKADGTYRHLLGFNEPDLGDQANMSVSEALSLWPRLESTGLRLGSPAPIHPGPWLDAFMSGAATRGYRVDFVALHFYQDFTRPHAVAELRSTLEQTYARYGKPIWITELGAVDIRAWGMTMHAAPTDAAAATYIRDVIAMLETLPFVERYAWFIDTGSSSDYTSLYDSSGRLTSQGTAFQHAAGSTAPVAHSVQQAADPTVPPASSVPRPGSYRLVNRERSTNALHLTGETYKTGIASRNVVTTPVAWDAPQQRWQLTAAGDGYYRLTSLSDTGFALQAAGDRYLQHPGVFHVAGTPAGWWTDEQLWSIRPTGDGYFRLVNKAWGTSLQAGGDPYPGWTEVFRSVTSPAGWNIPDQHWTFVPS